MKEGDLVRFVKWEELDTASSKSWREVAKKNIGTLVKHDRLMQTCEVLYRGKIVKLRSQLVEKAGRKDVDGNKE